jgi:hypothetical protein
MVAAGVSPAAEKPDVAFRSAVSTLYAKDHKGVSPKSDAALLPYSKAFQRIVASCTIGSENLMNDAIWWAGKASRVGAPRVSSLMMMQAITRLITWSGRRSCWNTFDAVEHRMEMRSVSALIANRHEVSALYVIDHQGLNPRDDTVILPYSKAFQKILASCTIGAEDLTNAMIELAAKASELGARHVSSLMMMNAVTRRITWAKQRIACWSTFDDAEGHMENGGP